MQFDHSSQGTGFADFAGELKIAGSKVRKEHYELELLCDGKVVYSISWSFQLKYDKSAKNIEARIDVPFQSK